MYYDNLNRVREKNDLLNWLKYFLIGIEQTATQAVETLRAVMILKSDLENEINREFGRRTNSAFALINEMFGRPAVTKAEVQEICGLSKKAASELVNIFSERGYLRETTGNPRNQMFVFDPYIKLFE